MAFRRGALTINTGIVSQCYVFAQSCFKFWVRDKNTAEFVVDRLPE